MKRPDERGSQIVIITLAVLVLGIAGFAAWRVMGSDKTAGSNTTSSDSSASSTKTENSETKLTKTYKNTLYKFSVKYPEDWTELTTSNSEDSDYPTVTAELKSPQGTVLHLRTDYGGFGGNCDPGDGSLDQGESSSCPTEEYLHKEVIKAETYDDEKRDGKTKIPIYLVRSSLKGADNTIYKVGLITDRNNEIKLNTPNTGLHMSFHYFAFVNKAGEYKGNIYAYSQCDSKESLGGNLDCGISEKILKTFSFYE